MKFRLKSKQNISLKYFVLKTVKTKGRIFKKERKKIYFK